MFTLPVSKVFSQACNWVSKCEILGISMVQTHTVPLGECLTRLLLFPRLFQESGCMITQQFGVYVYVKHSRKSAPRLTALSQCPCSYAWQQCSILAPSFFCPKESSDLFTSGIPLHFTTWSTIPHVSGLLKIHSLCSADYYTLWLSPWSGLPSCHHI